MPVQFTTLSIDEQQKRVAKIARDTLFPYTYDFNIPGNSLNLSNAAFQFMTLQFIADQNMAIAEMAVQLSNLWTATGAGNVGAAQFVEVSYSSTPSIQLTGAPATPQAPTDVGNVIYRNDQFFNLAASGGASAIVGIDNYRMWDPYIYVLKFNQSLYMHIGLDATSFALGSFATSHISGSFTFHMLVTGVKT